MPAYDLICTTIYLPRDTRALTLRGSKKFPDRAELVRFVRQTTGTTEARATELLAQVGQGVRAAIAASEAYGKQHADAHAFSSQLVGSLLRGLARCGLRAD